MSAVRDLLAAAASEVDGLTGHAYFASVTTAGNVLVRLERTEYPNKFGGVCHWNLVLILPQDQKTAEQFAEEKVPLLRAAAAPHLVITSVVPQQLKIDGLGVLPTVFINGHREED